MISLRNIFIAAVWKASRYINLIPSRRKIKIHRVKIVEGKGFEDNVLPSSLSLSLFFERSPRGFSHVLNSRLEGAYLSTGGETSGGRAKSSRRGVATEYVTVTYCLPCRVFRRRASWRRKKESLICLRNPLSSLSLLYSREIRGYCSPI